MTKTPRMSLRGLRTFCAAARHESFRLAGDELFVTASAVSHQIKSLEQEFGETLFERGSRALTLTEAGLSLFEEMNPLIEQIDTVAARHARRDRRTSLRISVQPFFASEVFIPRLSEFTEAHPDIDIRIDTNDETTEKLPANADIAIRLFRTPPSDADADLLFPLRLLPAGSPEFKKNLIVRKRVIQSRFPMLVHNTRAKAWREWQDKTRIAIPDTAKIIRLDSMIAVSRAAERGIGAALVPATLSQSWFESGVLVPLFEQELVTDEGYYVVCNKDKARQPHIKKLHDWVLQNFDGY